MDFETRLHTLQTQLDASRADITAKDQEILRSIEEQEQLDQRFIASQKRISELEASISTLRQQLEQARMETSEARVEIENAQEGARVARVGLREARAEADAHINELGDRLKGLKDAKANAEGRVMELENEREAFLEAHKMKSLELRNKAEDAVKKVSAMLDLERAEKKKVGKEIKKLKEEVSRLTAELEKRSEESEDKDEDVEEVQTLRELLRKQVQATKAAKMEAQATRKELESLRTEMETQKEDFKAVNMEMDERLALLLRSITKERAKTAIELRDGQWVKNMERLQGERELMGKVLMREWGKQECGAVAADENQAYRYLYVKR
jgi:chromosome segregation ATPase